MCFEPQHPQALPTTPLHPRIDAISMCHFQVVMGLKIHPDRRRITADTARRAKAIVMNEQNAI
jgi:hypothetical protein